MKRYYNMLRSIAVMAIFGLMASCTIQEEAELVNRPDAFNHYYATIEETSAPDTKVYADEQLKVLWNAGDCISVFGKYTYNQEYVFKGQTGDNSGTFEKVENGAYVTGNDLPSVWAVYPYMETTSISNDGELSVVFPSVQSYADKTFGLGANVMVSATDDNNLKFRNAGGVLVIKLYGNGVSVNSVSLKGNKGEKIAGAATVTMAVGGTPAVVMGDQATDAITLACAEPVAIGSSADSCTEFWFVLPPTEFQDGITVSVNGEGGVFEKSTAKAISITRNHLSRMAPVEVSLSYPVPEAVDLGLPSGTFWASWNLGASSPKEKGELFAWGEIETKETYTLDNYKWSVGNQYRWTKYNQNFKDGSVDDNTILLPEDDAATVNLGDGWHIPSVTDWVELRDERYCAWKTSVVDGVEGSLITSLVNGKSIFLPNGPSTTLYTCASLYPLIGSYSQIYSFTSNRTSYGYGRTRFHGELIRPVYGVRNIPSEISLTATSMTIKAGQRVKMSAILSPEDVREKVVIWHSDAFNAYPALPTQGTSEINTETTDVDILGVASGLVTVTASICGLSASCTVTVDEPEYIAPEKVDLGLPSGIYWASCNLGGLVPEDCGAFYSWGETAPKAEFESWNYKWYDSSSGLYTKYADYVDGKTELDPEDDAAFVNLGGSWRMPTKTDLEELFNPKNCNVKIISQNGVLGYKFTSVRNGNSLFIPSTGYFAPDHMYYSSYQSTCWTSTLKSNDNGYRSYLYSANIGDQSVGSYRRFGGFPIRPVYDDDRVSVESIELDKTSMQMKIGDTYKLSAILTPANAYDALFWSSSAPSVASVSNEGLVTAIGAGSATISATAYNGLSATCEITVARDNNALRAKWRFTTSLLSNYANYFGGTSGIVDKEEGFGGLYVPSNVEGNGRIEYYQIDKSAYSVSGNPKRMVGATGHPYVTGAWPGDYWLFSASDGHEYSAGTQLHIKYLTRISATGQKYWMLEYFDGEAWKQAKEYEVSTEAETGTSAQYNYIAKTSNEIVECSWTLAAPCSEPKFRMRCVANWQSNGNGALAKPNGGTSRIADNDDDGEDAGPVLEVTSEP